MDSVRETPGVIIRLVRAGFQRLTRRNGSRRPRAPGPADLLEPAAPASYIAAPIPGPIPGLLGLPGVVVRRSSDERRQ
ncbi:hypothetical protein ACPPVO_59390 [Dactylosporangium sp. McL0621]|uniref:hypothetical protein n=1 Tax=Dactylosporangium sp. McL0621 TaxID=3415678 RepID=UPI003CF9458C